MKTKQILCPERLRHVPHQFSWIDQRLVREGHIARCALAALALYLLLVTVADAQGLSAAFRELLVLRGDRYQWRISPYELFPKCAEQLYKVLLNRSGKAKIISHLGTDTEYWGACAQIVMRVQTSLLEEKFSQI